MVISKIWKKHYAEVANIYLQGIATGNATFQQEAPTWDEWDENHLQHSRVGVFENNTMLGWAALSPVSKRTVYKGVAEVSIYIGDINRGKGVGVILLQQLIKHSEENGIWTLQSGIFPENIASIHLHKKCGFREIGFRERIGNMNGIWRDNIMMERRSNTIGV